MNQVERLEEVFKKNQNRGLAVAITGCWGIGKTFFWKKFLKDQTIKEYNLFDSFYYEASKFQYINVFENKKYAYISLFGIETLDALKNEISIKIGWNPHSQNIHKHYGIPQLIRNALANFKDIKISHSGFSSSSKLIESLLYAQVKDAIICFDDFERLSEKLKIQDVMGLANQLKLERNCQVILILDELKTKQENEKKYAEYKEKLIDETIKITSVEPLIRVNTKDIDENLVDLMVKFADELEIHNFRFFQKVINLYKQFRAQLPDEVAYSTKEIILVRILQGYFIEDYGIENGLKWEDFSTEKTVDLIDSNEEENQENRQLVILKKLQNLSYSFVFDNDRWLIEFRKWFDQKGAPDFGELKNLANSDLISEKNNSIKEDIRELMHQWRNLQVDSTYCEKLYKLSQESIPFNDLQNLDFHCFLLKKFGRNDLSKKLKRSVIDWLNQELQKDYEHIWDEATSFGYKKGNLFHWYIKCWKAKNPKAGLPSLFDVLKVYILDGGIKNKANLALKNAVQNDWENFIFSESSVDSELKKIHKGKIMTKILQQNIDMSLTPKIKRNIEEILMNKI